MTMTAYLQKRAELETYFDRTAHDAWRKLTSDAPVSGVRASVRAGRDAMRSLALSWLPPSLAGLRILDAGCGPGQVSMELARRGAHVVAVDLSPNLLDLARERIGGEPLAGSIEFIPGDMCDERFGAFDIALAMDSLIHYPTSEIASALARLAPRIRDRIIFTIAPQTPALAVMHAIGGLFPKGDRAPAIRPTSPSRLAQEIAALPALRSARLARSERIHSSFYVSQAMELVIE